MENSEEHERDKSRFAIDTSVSNRQNREQSHINNGSNVSVNSSVSASNSEEACAITSEGDSALVCIEAPGGPVGPSDQGDHETCTRHAMGKASKDGFYRELFQVYKINSNGKGEKMKLDLDQGDLIKALESLDNDNMLRVWPTRFHKVDIPGVFHDIEENKDWKIKILEVAKITKDILLLSMKDADKMTKTFVLVKQLQQPIQRHCVYIKNLLTLGCPPEYFLDCSNSVKGEERCVEPIDNTGNRFYSVLCDATENIVNRQVDLDSSGQAKEINGAYQSDENGPGASRIFVDDELSQKLFLDSIVEACKEEVRSNIEHLYDAAIKSREKEGNITIKIFEVVREDFLEGMIKGDAKYIIVRPYNLFGEKSSPQAMNVEKLLEFETENQKYALCRTNLVGVEKTVVPLDCPTNRYFKILLASGEESQLGRFIIEKPIIEIEDCDVKSECSSTSSGYFSVTSNNSSGFEKRTSLEVPTTHKRVSTRVSMSQKILKPLPEKKEFEEQTKAVFCKAICSGFKLMHFVHDISIDLQEREVMSFLDFSFPEKNGNIKQIVEINSSRYNLEMNEEKWSIHLADVKRIEKSLMVQDMFKEKPNYSYIIVFLRNPEDLTSSECVFVSEILSSKKGLVVVCEAIRSTFYLELNREDIR